MNITSESTWKPFHPPYIIMWLPFHNWLEWPILGYGNLFLSTFGWNQMCFSIGWWCVMNGLKLMDITCIEYVDVVDYPFPSVALPASEYYQILSELCRGVTISGGGRGSLEGWQVDLWAHREGIGLYWLPAVVIILIRLGVIGFSLWQWVGGVRHKGGDGGNKWNGLVHFTCSL